MRLKVWIALATIYVVWGSTFLAIAVVVRDLPPFLAMAMRHLAAGALVFAWIMVRRREREPVMPSQLSKAGQAAAKKAAQNLGLDTAKLETDMNSPETDKLIKDDLAVAAATDVTGTPSFFINGKRVTNRSFEGMKAMVDEELKKAKGAN